MKFLTISALAATAGMGLWGQTPTNPALKTHTSMMQTGKSLSVVFSLTRMPAAPIEATLTYAKPGMYRIETSDKLIVCDGKVLRELNKADNTFTEVEASNAGVLGDEVWAWAAFFVADPFKEAKAIMSGAKRMIKGVPTQEVTMQLPSGKTATLYIDTKLGIARGGSVKKGDSEMLAIAKEINLTTDEVAASTFAWAPPAGAKKAEKPKPTADVKYAEIDAIFTNNCKGCHGISGGLSLDSYTSTMAGKRGIPVVVAGEPDRSSLYRAVRSGSMPKMGSKLSADKLKQIENWILGGAKE